MNTPATAEVEGLLPCPFCGGAAHEMVGVRGDHGFAVQCERRYCLASTRGHPTREAANERWNTRSVPSPADLEERLFEFFNRKYVQRADGLHRMGLQYTNAETHDLAKETARFIAAMPPQREGWMPIEGAPEGDEESGPLFDVIWAGEKHRYLPAPRREIDCFCENGTVKRKHGYPSMITVFRPQPTHWRYPPAPPIKGER